MRVLVTGGAGFIGSHITHAALEVGHDVVVVDDLSTGKRSNIAKGATFFQVDIRDREGLARVFESYKPEVVSHQAAQASVSLSVRDPSADASVNVLGTLSVLDAARAVNARVIFASTGGAIYGEVADGLRADPSWVPRPISPYAAAKLAAEAYLAVYRAQYALDYRILRYANVYGPRQDPHGEAGVVAIFAERLLRGDPISVFARREVGDAGCVRDYVYVSDVARANLAAIAGEVAEPVMNVGTGVATTTLEIAHAVEAALGLKADVQFAATRPGDLERSILAVADADWARNLVPLAEGMGRTVEWYRATRS